MRRGARGRWLCGVLIALSACGPRPINVSAPRSEDQRDHSLILEGEGAHAYNEAYNEPASPRSGSDIGMRLERLIAEEAPRLGVHGLQRDPRLDAAAQALARILPEEGHVPFELVEFAVQHHGIIDPIPHLIIAVITPEVWAAFESDLVGRLPQVLKTGRYRRFGIGALPWGEGQRVVVAFQESYVRMDPIPRSIGIGKGVKLRGSVHEPFARVRVLVTRPDGHVERLGSWLKQTFEVTFECTARGRHQVELIADDPFGPTVLANFPLYCGIPVPKRAEITLGDDGPVGDAASAERRLYELLNGERQRAGLSPLIWDTRLADVAREHSKDMFVNNFVGHLSPRTGDPSTRATRVGLRPRLLLENVARAYSVGEAHRGLMQSPGHRQNCFSREVTHVGIGVVLGRDVGGRKEIFVTQLFAAEVVPAVPVDGMRRIR